MKKENNSNGLIKKILPVANKIYKECMEEGLTTEEFDELTRLLWESTFGIRTIDDKKKLSEC